MDKWDEMISRVKNGILAEEPEAALSGALEMFAEFSRTIEQMGADMARIADAVQPQNVQTVNKLEMVGVDEFFFSNYPERSGDDEHIIFNREDEERLVNRDDLEEFWNMLDEQAIAEDPAQEKFDL